MVQVEVRDEEQVDLVGLDHVDEGERVHAGEAGVDAAVEQDALLLELEHVARPAHLLPGAQRADDHPVLLGAARGDRPAEDVHVRHGGDVHRGARRSSSREFIYLQRFKESLATESIPLHHIPTSRLLTKVRRRRVRHMLVHWVPQLQQD